MEPLLDKLARQRIVRRFFATIQAGDKYSDDWVRSMRPILRIGFLVAAACLVLPIFVIGMDWVVFAFMVLFCLGHILLLPNFCMIVCAKQNWCPRAANFAIFLAYAVPMAALFFDEESFFKYFGLTIFLFPFAVPLHFCHLTFAWQKLRPDRAWKIVKFVVSLCVLATVCTTVWQDMIAENLYDCTDDNLMAGFLQPGNWVHAWDDHPIVVVDHIVHGRSMSDPDTIKNGWSVAGLWLLWFSFISVSSVISVMLARVRWIPKQWLADERRVDA